MTLVNLHFAGSRLYSPEKFEAEAARVGVARRLPAFAIRNLAFGDYILLATFRGRRGEDGHVVLGDNGKPVRLGSADAWGAFFVNGLNIDAPPEFRMALVSRLHIVEVMEFDEPQEVERECGSYSIQSVAIVRDSIREIIDIGEALAKDLGVIVKWSVTGTFRPLAPHIVIDDVPFTRTIVRVFLEDWTPFETPPEAEADGRPLYFIGDYSMRRYRPMTDDERAAANRRRIEAANRGRLAKLDRMRNDDAEASV